MLQFNFSCPLPALGAHGWLRWCWSAPLWLGGLLLVTTVPGLCQLAGSGSPAISSYKKLSLAQLMDIEVTSVSRRPEPLSDAASAVQVLTADEIQRSGATGIPSALRLFPNLHVARIDARQWAVAARGFNNTTTNKLLVQLDGRTLYTPLFAGVFWDVQDTLMEDVERIEVISGPGATQWGSNAVNGVINITTKPARDTQGGLLQGGMGSELQLAGAARYGGTVAPGLYYRVYGKHTQWDGSVTPRGAAGGDDWDLSQGGFRVDWERTTNDEFTFQGDIYRGVFGQPSNGDIRVKGSNLLGRWTRRFAADATTSLQFYHDYTHRMIPGVITERLAIDDVDFQHQLPSGERHQFMWGASYRQMEDRLENAEALAFLPARATRRWVSGFVQNEWRTADGEWRYTAGVKAERNPYTGTEFQPTFRVARRWTERQMAWGAISRALRTPSRIDREFFVPAEPPYLVAGGPDFVSEKLIAYELGYRAEPRSGLALSLAAFFHDYDDLRSLEPADDPAEPAQIANGLVGSSHGAELNVTYRPNESWRIRFGYTEQRVKSEVKPGSRDQISVRSQSLDPDRYLQLGISHDFSTNLSFDVTTRHVSRIANHEVPAYVELDFRLSWRPRADLELALRGRNLLDRSHPEFGATASRREVQRNVHGSFTWRF